MEWTTTSVINADTDSRACGLSQAAATFELACDALATTDASPSSTTPLFLKAAATESPSPKSEKLPSSELLSSTAPTTVSSSPSSRSSAQSANVSESSSQSNSESVLSSDPRANATVTFASSSIGLIPMSETSSTSPTASVTASLSLKHTVSVNSGEYVYCLTSIYSMRQLAIDMTAVEDDVVSDVSRKSQQVRQYASNIIALPVIG